MSNEAPLLEVRNLTKHFPVGHGKEVHAVNGVSFTLEKGETLGIVGESGCGKSSMGRTILKVHEPTSGQIIFEGNDITKLSNKKMFSYRKKMQMIFQDPYASLNPRFTVGEIIEEPMIIHKMGTAHERKAIVQELIETVLNLTISDVILMNFQVVRDRELELPERWHYVRNLLCVTSQYQHWMYPFRHRSSICWKNYKEREDSAICLSLMT